jgi:ABC-2 type transport system permease protein
VSLYRAETRRLVKRRFVRWLVVGTLLVLAAVAGGMAVTNEKTGPAQIAAAKVEAERQYQEQLTYWKQEPPHADAPAPTQADFDYRDYLPPTFDFRKKFGDMVVTLAALLALAAFVLGASFVGAEWSSGGMMNLLLWRPQRLRVLSTKLGALLTGLTGLTAVVAAAWTGIFAVIAALRGSTATMTAGAWRSFGLMEVRALLLVLVAGAVGFGLASLGRHTAVALGVAAGAVVVLQFGLVTVLAMAQVKFAEAWLAPTWLSAWLNKSSELRDYAGCNGPGECRPDTLTITWPTAGAVMAAALVLVVGTAMWTMRKRDVT